MSGLNVVLARNTAEAPQNPAYSQTVAFSHYNNIAGQLPVDPQTGNLVEGGVREQATQCFKNLAAVVESIEHDLTDVVRVSVFVTDIRDTVEVDRVLRSFFPTYVPARTTVAVDALPEGASVMIDALLTNGEGTIPNEPQAGDLVKLTNNTHGAPLDGTSTQTVAFSHYNNLTMQLPLDPATNRPLSNCVCAQTRQCLANVKAILNSIDVPFDDIVKVNVFVTDLKDVDSIDGVYRTFFFDSGIARAHGYVPARTIVPVKELPYHARVAIEAVVSHGDGTPPQAIEDRHNIIVEAVETSAAPQCELSTQSVAFSHYNHLSGQLPVDVASGELVSGDATEQARVVLSHLKAIAEACEHSLEDTVKVNVYLADLADLDAVEVAYREFFPEGTPARRVVGTGVLPLGARVMMDAILGNAEGTPPVK